MSARSAAESAASPTALSAFLKGVERRADTLASLQCGDLQQAERGLAATFRAFQSRAGEWPMAVWPTRFWALLAATPALREPGRAPHWPQGLEGLAPLSADDRLALLLRIVVGLDEAAAADVLGVDEDAYRHALARACPRDAAGHPDAHGWRLLAEAAQRQLRELAPERLGRLADLREPRPPVAAPARAQPAERTRVPRAGRLGRLRSQWRWIVAGCVLLALLAAAAAWMRARPGVRLPPEPVSQAPAGALHVTDAAPVLVEELPAEDLDRGEQAPVPAPGADPADAAMLADPDLALARQADFYAWFAAGGPVPADESQPRPTAPDLAAAGMETVTDDE
ncbi:hypothetical protein P6166_07045 [Stenotrophomonas sp. HITSZ_GD]|uniref:hypothetical protein n=1 Tax=Stenotrophomonas sp. HITSZ_GD TaxID=3037248 RepID=UPI00240DF0EF|nr:hypothetical protein [Stenotrophomonas sp. HITSZ_GD]MDG2525109.1 hypothetical protein [Stenotrophomonas sp. HITSZ_GD]